MRGVAVEHRAVWEALRERILGDGEPRLVKRMTRFCPGCGGWVEFDYLEVDGKVWGACRACPYLVRRYPKTYIKGLLDNPIHAREEVLFEAPRFQELVDDRVIDIGFQPAQLARGRRVE